MNQQSDFSIEAHKGAIAIALLVGIGYRWGIRATWDAYYGIFEYTTWMQAALGTDDRAVLYQIAVILHDLIANALFSLPYAVGLALLRPRRSWRYLVIAFGAYFVVRFLPFVTTPIAYVLDIFSVGDLLDMSGLPCAFALVLYGLKFDEVGGRFSREAAIKAVTTVGIVIVAGITALLISREQQYTKGERAIVDKDYATAFALLEPLAQHGHVGAQKYMALMYSGGLGVRKNIREAFQWHKRAADSGSADSQLIVGSSYLEGYGVDVDREKGAYYIRLSAEQGIAEAQMTLGSLYHFGEGVPADQAEAVKWMRRAAEQGISPPIWFENVTDLDED